MNKDIEHLHFEECESTQLILREEIDNRSQNSLLLVSAISQSKGRGRSGSKWESPKNSLAMSFIIDPCQVLTLTSLELGAIICNFFEDYSLKLKWPNDLLTKDGLKCGGIICQTYKDKILVGLGINYGVSTTLAPSLDFKFGKSHITEESISSEQSKEISKEIYSFIINNRLSVHEIELLWKKHCLHYNKPVLISDNNVENEGIFIGIGKNGEALLKNKGSVKSIYTGSLSVSTAQEY